MPTCNITTEGDLLIITVTGKLTAEDVISVINEYYPNGIVQDVIWNLTDGSMSLISKQGFQNIASAALTSLKGGARQGGKTVYVGLADVEYGLLRMYSAIAEMAGIPIEYRVFRTLEEARNWLGNV